MRYSQENPTESPYRWVMLGLIWFLYFSFGMVSSSIAPLLSEIKADLEISDALMGTALGAWPLVYIFAAMPAGSAIDRFGQRKALAFAGVIMALSQLLRAFSIDYPTLFLAIAIFGLGGPLISIGAPAMVADWFSSKERPMALGIYITAPAIGGVIALYTANAVVMPLTGENWRLTLAVYGSICILAALIWTTFARDAKHEEVAAGEAKRGDFRKFLNLGKVPQVQIVLVMAIGIFMFSHGANNWLPELLRRSGMTRSEAGFWAAVPTLVGVVSTLLITRFVGQGQTRLYVTIVSVFIVDAIAAALIASATGAPQIGGLIALGMGRAAAMPLMMLVLLSLPAVGAKNMGIAGGLYFTFGEVGGVLGPSVVGVISQSSSLETGFYMLGMISVALTVLAIILRVSATRVPVLATASSTT
jgi:cyanate permease